MNFLKQRSIIAAGIIILLGLQLTLVTAVSAASLEVIYPRPQSAMDTRENDVIELLQMALKKTENSDGPFELRPAKKHMNESRYRMQLKKGRKVSIIWSTVTQELEKELLPIRIPIRRGILGYRVFLIRKQDKDRFSAIHTLAGLKKLRVGQGRDWNDVHVFRHNKFNLVTGSTYEGLFGMLIKKRFDYFSRGINEAWPEYETRKNTLPDLYVEQNILLYYPWPKYFFVSPQNTRLADRIKRGLNVMIKEGSFVKLFYKYNQPIIDRANLKNRRLFKIDNPLLPATAPIERKELWYDPIE